MDASKDYINDVDEKAERRYFKVEVRQDTEGKVEGVAAVTGDTTNLGWFQERIAPGAFDNVLKTNPDVVALFNHDPNLPVARTNGGGLDLRISNEGNLVYNYNTPDTQIGRDLEVNIKSNIIKQSSFAFTIKREKWTYARNDQEMDLREILEIDKLFDVSPVTYPAYQNTTVAARNKKLSEVSQETIDKEKRESMEKALADMADMDKDIMDKELRKLNIGQNE